MSRRAEGYPHEEQAMESSKVHKVVAFLWQLKAQWMTACVANLGMWLSVPQHLLPERQPNSSVRT